MDDLTPPPVLAEARERFDALVRDIRIELHRYCARMVGSAIDGEDIVQDALARACYLLPTMHSVANLRGWLFRIAWSRAGAPRASGASGAACGRPCAHRDNARHRDAVAHQTEKAEVRSMAAHGPPW